MPCWYFDKKDLQKTPSFQDGINAETEAKYRREGARFIMDAGSKMKLHYNTCASGVVYFHRFYLFHSFKEFHRHVMAVCCLFLAGKVEETPKKCKDLIKTTQSMLTEEQFAVFGKDPREEVMTLERILLQTIKFDLMVEHPYAYVVKFAKQIKGDKAKIEKMAQMAWTFVNDSLCTTLCLQWEAEVVAVAMMYLTSRLSRFEPTDWHGKPSSYRGKWYEFLVKDVTLELLEDICHQVLDLYSKPHLKSTSSPAVHNQPPSSAADESMKSTPKTPISPQVAKRPAPGTSQGSRSAESSSSDSHHSAAAHSRPAVAAAPIAAAPVGPARQVAAGESYSQANPYIATQMYSSSFMSQEGTQSIQSLIGGAMGGDNSNVQHYQKDGSSNNTFQASAVYQQPPNVAQAPPSSTNPAYSQSYPYSGPYQTGYDQNYPSQAGPIQNYPVQPGSGQPHAGYYDSRSQHQQQYMNESLMHAQHHSVSSHTEDSQSGHSRHWQ